MPPTAIATPAALADFVGQEVGVSGWMDVTQARITAFADVTEDHQWIHEDAERAARESPFGGTIAHGFLTLSLLSALAAQAVEVGGARLTVNYGFDRVRFVSPVPAGSRVRARLTLAAVAPLPGGGVEAAWDVTVERDGGDRPCLTARWLARMY
jgi:acyl dehydratase